MRCATATLSTSSLGVSSSSIGKSALALPVMSLSVRNFLLDPSASAVTSLKCSDEMMPLGSLMLVPICNTWHRAHSVSEPGILLPLTSVLYRRDSTRTSVMPAPRQPLPPSSVSSHRSVSHHMVPSMWQSFTVSRAFASLRQTSRCDVQMLRCSSISLSITASGTLRVEEALYIPPSVIRGFGWLVSVGDGWEPGQWESRSLRTTCRKPCLQWQGRPRQLVRALGGEGRGGGACGGKGSGAIPGNGHWWIRVEQLFDAIGTNVEHTPHDGAHASLE